MEILRMKPNWAMYLGFILSILWGYNYCSAAANGPYFLPTTIIPQNYKLLVYTNMDTDKHEYWGTVDIKVVCNESTNVIVLNASKELTIPPDSITVQLLSNNGNNFIQINPPTRDEDNDLLNIPLKENLAAQAQYLIHLSFSSVLQTDSEGYYLSTFTDTAGQKRLMALTQFGYSDARTVFPCFDQINLKATFITTIAHTDKYFALSNMPIASTSNEADQATGINWVLDTFEETLSMSTLALSWAIVDVAIKSTEIETQQSKVRIYVWAREQVMAQVELVKNTASTALTNFETFFSYTYPLKQMHIIFVEDQYDPAHDGFGFMLFAEELLLYDQATTTKYMMFYIVSTTCFEIADQWAPGMIATTVWWDYNDWLTAAIPTYFGWTCSNQLYPNWALVEYTIVDTYIETLTDDSRKDVLPVARLATDINATDNLIDDVVYQKGTYLMRMANLFMGDSAFQQGFTAYIQQFKFSSATADDLWNSLTGPAQQAGRLPEGFNMKQIMDPWSYQPGGPVVIAERDYPNRKITLKQRRFLLQVKLDDSDKSCWPMPVTFVTSRDPGNTDTTPKYWLTCKGDLQFDLDLNDNEFIIFNNNLMVPSRFHYDKTQWMLIQNILTNEKTFNQISAFSRVQLLSDMSGLTWSGLLDYSIAFHTFTYLKFETNYFCWYKVLPLLGGIRSYVYKSNFLEPYTVYVKNIVEQKFISLKDLNTLPEEYVDVQFKLLLINWGCVFNLADCRKQCADIFEWWSKDPDKNLIVSDFRIHIFCNALLVGNENQWTFLQKRYLNSQDASEKSDILQSLGCSQDVNLLNKALDMSLDIKAVRQEDSSLVFRGISDNDIGYPVLKAFITTRYQEIYNYQGGDETRISDYLHVFSSYTITQNDLNDMKKFFDWVKTFGNVPGLKDQLDRDTSTAEENVKWFQTYEAKFRDIVTGKA